MNRALFYLWCALLKRKTLRYCASLRRPTTLIGLAALLSFLGFLFYYRQHEIFGQLVRPETMIGCALVMLGGSLFRGILQRGLAFELADVEFVFTGPFTQRQVVLYRLLPNYLFALVQGLVFVALFGPHLKHPLLTTICFIFFQIVCFHLATAMSLFAGSLSEHRHHRVRWMLLGVYFLLTAVYLRAAWDIKLVPAIISSPFTQLLFYPAVTLSDAATGPAVTGWALHLMRTDAAAASQLAQSTLYFVVFAASAVASLWLLFKFKANVFEASLMTTNRTAEKRLRLQQGRRIAAAGVTPLRSARLPGLSFFRGVGAIVWKNLVVARRSKRELILAFVFTLIFTVPLIALLWLLHDLMSKGVESPAVETTGFHTGVALFLGSLAFLLQRTFPFDFRGDGHHLMGFRTLPVSPFALVLAEIAVPTVFCLAFQALGVAVLLIYARFDWTTVLSMLLAYPAVALAVNAVWNLRYLLSVTRRIGGRAQSVSAVGTLMVVTLSFLIFYPAGWSAVRLSDWGLSVAWATAGFLFVQYLVDFILVLTLAQLFQRFEVPGNSR